MKATYFLGTDIATTDHDGTGRCTITWADGETTCDGWIEGDRLFAPSDGDSTPGWWFDDDGSPSSHAGWYEVTTGQEAIFGLPGCTMAVLG